MKRPARVPLYLPETLHKRLNAYALAASAAGAGVLALAQPAEAKVVYTPAHAVIRLHQIFPLGLAHDGQVDFSIWNFSTHTTGGIGTYGLWLENGEQRNCAAANFRYPSFAAALPKGVRLSSKQFVSCGQDMVLASGSHGWGNAGERYLGLKFYIGKEIHYGWARLNVSVSHFNGIVATLTGYAYETIPNKPIITGKTHGEDEATLGHLAAGASAIPASRQKQ
jgi:hypothetical protein